MCPKEEIQFFFRLSLNAIKRLWCNADTQMLFDSLRSRQIFVRKLLFFNIYVCAMLAKVIRIIATFVPLPKHYTDIKLRHHQLVFRLHRFSSWLRRGRKEN